MSYEEFIAGKAQRVASHGFEAGDLGETLYPFQGDIVRWACRLGRAAIFADCGMGKTPMQLAWANQVQEQTDGDILILAPLAVAQQTVREAQKFGIPARYCRSDDERKSGITVANYEMLSAFDPGDFAGVVLDESSILKSYDGKTRTEIIEAFRETPYRLACTATPSPNDFTELGNHSEFLGTMTRSEMLSMFFVHDGGSTKDWRLKGHAEDKFWEWVCQWAVMIRKPSDLGYDDGAFILPPLKMIDHVVDVDHSKAWSTGTLFQMEARTMDERRAARRGSIDQRVAECARLVSDDAEQWIVWCQLNAEGDALTAAIPGAVQVAGADSREFKEQAVLDFIEGRTRVLVSKVSIFGFGLNLQRCARMAFVGLSDSYEQLYQAIRRCWRFGQSRAVRCHVITSETEGAVVANIQRKEAEAAKMAAGMVENMRDLIRANVKATARSVTEYRPTMPMQLPSWLASEVA